MVDRYIVAAVLPGISSIDEDARLLIDTSVSPAKVVLIGVASGDGNVYDIATALNAEES